MMLIGAMMLAAAGLGAEVAERMFIFAMAGLAAPADRPVHVTAVYLELQRLRAALHGRPDTSRGHQTAQGARVSRSAFSFKNTIPLVGVLAGFGIYSWWSAFIGGEGGRQAPPATRNSAGQLNLISVAVFAIIFHTFGTAFLTAANGGVCPARSGRRFTSSSRQRRLATAGRRCCWCCRRRCFGR
jgi:hypothetical protein